MPVPRYDGARALADRRKYVGAHYPGDVMAGLLLGAVLIIAPLPLAKRILEPALRWQSKTHAFAVVIGNANARSLVR